MALWRRSALPRASRGKLRGTQRPPSRLPGRRSHAGRPQRHSRITENFVGREGESRRVKPTREAAGFHEGESSWEHVGCVTEEAWAAGGEWVSQQKGIGRLRENGRRQRDGRSGMAKLCREIGCLRREGGRRRMAVWASWASWRNGCRGRHGEMGVAD